MSNKSITLKVNEGWNNFAFAAQGELPTVIMGEDPQKVLDKYIYDYMKRKNMHETAEIFAQEANITEKEVAIDSHEGYLREWWHLFWDKYSPYLSPTEAGESSSKAVAATGNMPQNLHPIMPRSPMSSTGNVPQNFYSAIPRPPMSHQSIVSMQLNPFAFLPMPEMSQQAMNVMQAAFPILPRSEMNQQNLSGMHYSKGEVFANLPGSPGISVPHGQEMPTIFTKMYEQEYLKRSAIDLAANLQLLDVDKMPQMLRSSNNSSYQPKEILQQIQQQKLSGEIQQQQQLSKKIHEHLAKDDRRGINWDTSKAAVPFPEGAAQAALPETEIADKAAWSYSKHCP